MHRTDAESKWLQRRIGWIIWWLTEVSNPTLARLPIAERSDVYWQMSILFFIYSLCSWKLHTKAFIPAAIRRDGLKTRRSNIVFVTKTLKNGYFIHEGMNSGPFDVCYWIKDFHRNWWRQRHLRLNVIYQLLHTVSAINPGNSGTGDEAGVPFI